MRAGWLLRGAVLVPTLVVWELLVLRTGNLHLYPRPVGVLESCVRMVADGTLTIAVTQSLTRVLLAFCFAVVFGVAFGLLLGTSRLVDRAMSPIVDSLRSIAPIAWIPMAVLWLGVTGNAAIFIVAYAAVFPIILNTAHAVRLIDRSLVDAAVTLGASRMLLLRTVVFRSALPTILVGARIAMGFAWASIIAAELAMGIKLDQAAQLKIGLGQLMVRTLYFERDVNGLVLYMLAIGLIGIAIDQIMRRAHRAATPWQVT